MASPLIAGMPPDCALDFGCTIEFVAIDPLNGSTVTGVQISNALIYVSSDTPPDQVAAGPFMLVPGPNA